MHGHDSNRDYDSGDFWRMLLRVAIVFAIVGAMLGLALLVAHAHDWYPDDCCHAADKNGDHGECHPLASCDEIIPRKSGLEWHGKLMTGGQIRKSMDNRCHICATPSIGAGGEILPDTNPHCIFVYSKPDS